MVKVLVTGANGFIGRALCEDLLANGFDVVCAVRKPFILTGAKVVTLDNISEATDWTEALDAIDIVIHTAALGDSNKPYALYDRINVKGTLNLARQATDVRVKRFVFISTIKVNGETSDIEHPFSEQDVANPQGYYGQSKYLAEQELFKLAQTSAMELVIIRPPIVYGPRGKGNIERIFKLLKLGVVLPFGSIHNKRSLIYVKNLTSFIIHCLMHQSAGNQLFLVSDGCDVSTTELLKYSAAALKCKANLVSIPGRWIEGVAVFFGRRAFAQKLCGSLQVNNNKVHQALAWNPPHTLEEGLQITADYFCRKRAK